MVNTENSSINARIDSGSLIVGGELNVALNNSGRWSVMDVNGGTLTVNDTANGIALGGSDAGNAILLVRNGVTTTGKISLGFGSIVDTVVVNQTGGSLYIGSGGIAQISSGATANVTLNGGILGAATDWSSSVPMTLGGTIVQAGDATSAAHNITLSGALGGTTLVKTGNGTLTLGAANTYSGATAVTNGALIVNGSIGTGAVTVTNATLGGVGTIGGATTLQANSILAAGNGGIGTLTFTGNLTLDPASTNSFAVTTSGGASNKVAVVGALTPAGSTVRVTTGTPLYPGAYTLFTYGTVGGAFNPVPVFDVAPVHPASVVDNGAGHINLVVPNAAPVANTNTYTRNGLVTWKISVSDLLTNATDPDGDTVSLTSVGLSTNGVSLVISGAYVLYSNTNLVDDQFTYTVSDPYGATASGVVALTAGSTAGVGGQVNSFNANGGSASMTFAGIPGYSYNVQRSTDMSVWTTIWTTNAPTDGVFDFTDNSAPQPDAFYRLMWNAN
jgi:autotransporter-associated beta strand protein